MFMGNLVRDPELKETPNGNKVINFSIAVNDARKKKDKDGAEVNDVCFLDMEAWAQGAETIAKYFKKGSSIIVDASVRQDVWQDNEGKNRRSTKYRVNQFWFPPKSNKTEKAGEEASVGNSGGNDDGGDLLF
jgi:single-strand DNA-binding protein